ncbi:carotenoid oxygenase family protein [Pseudanabaena sp. UWO310]|uniref:carotenoid oxygenase family protein n=1 Tax=Pseudanabaena sp. UWO310 TaxID=2480795 RepID=UPI00116018E3|nr:carotenoid oxygenase family protein [Pseudanabaena sp. UWO310]TYQ24879.1 Apocarotenoid-15,15'-oxygenase [Pseudanabaena sp. UWO310]
MVQTASPTFSCEDWQKGYESLRTERSYWIDEVEGEIPIALEGTLFRNGPGQLDINGQKYGHPFDGDGMICAIAIKDGKAHFTNQFVKTPEFLAEQKAGKILYRGVFGTQKAGGWLRNIFDLRNKNVANTNVVYQGGKLLALWEAAQPYALNPKNLDTLGLENFEGKLEAGKVFTAHPRRDDHTGDLWGFGVQPGPQSKISIYQVNTEGKLSTESQVTVSGFCFLHDFAYTPNYRIFMQNPVSFKPLPFIFGFATAGECIELRPNTPSQFLLVDRQGNLQTLETDPCFVFHHCNAYEEGDEIIVDSVCYPDYPKLEPNTDFRNIDFDGVVAGQLYRFRINPKLGTVKRQLILERSCEFPVVNPRCMGQKYRYAYIGAIAKESGNAPLQAIAKVDVETGKQEFHSFAPRGFISEPIFVPRDRHADRHGAEDDGWIMTLVFDAAHNRSDLVILDAQNIAGKPVATLHLKHHVPYGLHGSFTDQVF